MAIGFNWTCPHCNRDQVVASSNSSLTSGSLHIEGLYEGHVYLTGHAIGCANSECRRLSLDVAVRPAKKIEGYGPRADHSVDPLFSRRLIPEGVAKPQPDFIPKALLNDYKEACLIKDLSPKASATLTRRCLQGMIRDFANIDGKTLYGEITALRNAVADGTAPQGVTSETVDAINHVRKVGNIGAHMEADINHIVEVDQGEAEALISLVELLFDEWYVARHRRQERLRRIEEISLQKDVEKQQRTD